MSLTPYVDGYFGAEREITVVPRPKFPFENNPTPDVYSRVYERDFEVVPTQYVPRTSRRTACTNLLTRSEEIDNSAWTKTNLTVVANPATPLAPDGQATMEKLLETVTNGQHSVSQAATVAAVATEAFVFAVAGLGRAFVRVAFTDSAATTFSAFFDVAAGVVGTKSAGVTALVVGLGENKFQCVIRFTPAAGAGTFKVNVASDASTISYAGDVTKGVYLWGAQVASGSATPYVSTTSATRAVSAPDRDPTDPMAYLLTEDDPRGQNSAVELITRFFGRVPLQQVVPSFIRISKPSPSSALPAAVGNYVVAQPDPAFASLNAYLRQFTNSDSGPAIPGGGAPTGGTYTISFAGSTTAPIAFNATAAAVQSALNAIASVSNRGGVLVGGDYLTGFSFTFAVLSPVTAQSAGLTGGPFTDNSNGNQLAGFFQIAQINCNPGAATGGTFTVTIFGQTTAAIAWNASRGTAQAAINALSNVAAKGGVTAYNSVDPVNGQNGFGLIAAIINFYFQYPAMTVNASGLTPSGSTATVSRTDNNAIPSSGYFGRQQLITFSAGAVTVRDTSTAVAHGITTADAIYAKVGDAYFLLSAGTFAVPSATALEFDGSSGAVTNAAGALSEVGKVVRTGYTPGSVTIRCVKTSTYYLPGVTAGINSAEDIPAPVYQGDPDTMLQIILAGVGTFNYDVGQLEIYRGPVQSLTVTTIRASDC